uniref:Uncharacterized protein n=1 Tax=Amphimedon queenslandica TaxID=400682 RepID=A0A1X7T0M8_AMPQE
MVPTDNGSNMIAAFNNKLNQRKKFENKKRIEMTMTMLFHWIWMISVMLMMKIKLRGQEKTARRKNLIQYTMILEILKCVRIATILPSLVLSIAVTSHIPYNKLLEYLIPYSLPKQL